VTCGILSTVPTGNCRLQMHLGPREAAEIVLCLETSFGYMAESIPDIKIVFLEIFGQWNRFIRNSSFMST
jgi:hypothetical protein